MKAVKLRSPGGLDRLENVIVVAPPKPGPGEITVRIRASSLNFHDYGVIALVPDRVPDGRIPMSDGAGEVLAVGDGVTEFKTGDEVVSTFFLNWLDGSPPSCGISGVPGDGCDGYAIEQVTVPAHAFTLAPKTLTPAESATLTCAGLTAWRGIVVNGQLKAGDVVLTQGTGGVSIFALQFAKAMGAVVISTSSSDEKLERLRRLGADHVINYKSDPEWGKTAKALTGGRGVDHVAAIGGPLTLAQCIEATRIGGHISHIGSLTGYEGKIPTVELMLKQIRLIGTVVGSRREQQDMVRAIDATGLKPVIDTSFPLDRLADAFRYQESGKHFGKIVVDI